MQKERTLLKNLRNAFSFLFLENLRQISKSPVILCVKLLYFQYFTIIYH